jgi:site-specific recombinase XerD
MLEQIILRKFYLQKHLDAPLLKEREDYVKHLQNKGLTRNYLLSIADYTLRIVQLLDLKDNMCDPVSLSAIEDASNRWSEMILNHPMKRKYSVTGKEKFITVAIEWLKYTGWLDPLFTDSNILTNMLFLRRFAGKKYLLAPFLQERINYLRRWEKNKASVAHLRVLATYQLHIIDYLRLVDLHPITEAEIYQAACTWAHENHIHGRIHGYSKFAERRFVCYAKGWLSAMGLLICNKKDMAFSGYLMQYPDYLSDERGYSPRTVENRYSQLAVFLEEIAQKCQSLTEITPSSIDAILCKRHETDHCNRKTISSIASVYRGFLYYAEDQGWCGQDLAKTIKAPRVYHLDGLPSAPPWEDILKVLEAKKTDNHTDIRDYAILLLLSVYGLRCSEVTGLKLKNIDWKKERLYLHRAKGGKPQIFPLVKTVGDAIIRYIREVRQNGCSREHVFLCRRAPYKEMSSSSVYLVVNRSLMPFDLKIKHHGPHCLRHGCATHLINSGFSLKEIAGQLGHQQLDTTRIYTKVDMVNLRKVAVMNWEELL